MINFLPIFPLNLVVFPQEKLNLHIFEPRYIQLITDCFAENKPFGIPVVVDNIITEFGCTVVIKEIVKVYDDGKMDIKTEGKKIFRLLELVKSIPEKLYSGAIVNYPDNNSSQNILMTSKVLALIKELHTLINATKNFKKSEEDLNSYDLAHEIGLSLKEEYEFLLLMNESQRLEFLKRHLIKIMPQAKKMSDLKERIHLNGHFKELGGFNF